MHSPRMQWSPRLAALAIEDVVCDRGEPDGDTLSEVIREVFRVDTLAGRRRWIAFEVGCLVLLHRHICKQVAR